MATVSIIVPVYNKESYIDACIQSILNQSFTDFELILVNDGSTDSSGVKCRHYQDRDERVKVIEQENAGVSAARNKGLSCATGFYVGFIDSDDTIEPDMYELLFKNAIKFDADIAVCRMRVVFPDKTNTPAETREVCVLDHHQALSSCLKGDLDRSANNKIYKTELVRQIRFEGHIYEDILYTCKAFLAAKKTVVEDAVKYNYIVRGNSVSMSKFNVRYLETIMVSAKMVELVSENDISCIPDAQAFDVVANLSLLNLILLAGKDKYQTEYNQVVKKLRSYANFIDNSAIVKRKHKYAFKLFSISPLLYRWGMYTYCRLTNAEAIKRA